MNGLWVLLIIAIYFAALLIISRITGGKDGGSNDAFFLGNRQSPWYIVSISMVGASLSGVTFVSVPGMVRSIDMTYMQTVLGFFVGYIVIARVLLPLYYNLRLTSIYAYLGKRIGPCAHLTGTSFFLLSKMIGAAARFYLVAVILQTYVFDAWGVPFAVTTLVSVALVWAYTFRGGIKTIVWTDTVQCICFIGMLVMIICSVGQRLGLDAGGLLRTISTSAHFRIFEWSDLHSTQHFAKQFVSGIFITIVMTGLDQDMMQKNLSCRNLREAQRNMYTYGFLFTPVNFLFLCLGLLLLTLASQQGITLPSSSDDILPMFCAGDMLGGAMPVFFAIGIIAAAFSSADSALAALTTAFCVDILRIEKEADEGRARRIRRRTHVVVAVVFALIILAFKALNNRSVIDAIYMIASYTYGPLLGLFTFGLFTRRRPVDRRIPVVCILSPIVCFALSMWVERRFGYTFSYEMLMINAAITFAGLWIGSEKGGMKADTC
ncbi:MAG: sodium:solute symporter [Tannerellaceae bacterium]|jgi:Na+/proline symporter|nr:sodium:solute symporter [Tannerellaceae bacterium]